MEIDLKKEGSKIPVTEQNKKEYIKLMVDWKLSGGVHEQMEALTSGLRELIPLDYLTPFDARELEWVIAGTAEINVEDWKANTVYSGGVFISTMSLEPCHYGVFLLQVTILTIG